MSIEDGNSGLTRRDFLGKAALFAGVISCFPGLAWAQERRTWIDDEWGPMAQNIPSELARRTLAVFHNPGQIGEVHDNKVRELLGEDANLQGEMADLATSYLDEYPELKSSLGYCHGFVNAVIYGEVANNRLQKQAAAVKHVADYQVPISSEEAIEYLEQGQMIGTYLAEKAGIWVRAGLEYNPRNRQILVTAYGYPDKWLPIDEAEGFYIPVHPGSTPLDERIGARLEERKVRLERNRSMYVFTSMRIPILDNIMYGTPVI